MPKKDAQAEILKKLQSLATAYSRGYRTNEVMEQVRPNVHEKQKWFLGMEQREVLYGGSAGGGKSDAILLAATQYIDIPGYAALILRRTYTDLSKSGALMHRANSWFAGTCLKKHDSGKKWVYPGGGTIEFGFVENDDDKFKFQCFHPDTEILTEAGWKFVKDVKRGESVPSMNPETREIELQQISKTHEYAFNGQMIDWYQRFGVSFCVTPNHSVWASTQRVKRLREYRADKLPFVTRIPQVGKWVGGNCIYGQEFTSDGNNGRSIKFSAKQWLNFMGRYLTQGNSGLAPSRYEIKFTQTIEPKKSELRELLLDLDINLHESQSFTFNHKSLAEYLNQFGTSRKRFIPRDLLGLNAKQSFILFNSMIRGNGNWITKDQAVFITTADGLKDDIMELAVYCGFRATSLRISHENNPQAFGDKPAWRLSFYRCPNDTICDTAERKETPYKGLVYCMTVPPHHTVLIRHRGRISWSGQSAEYTFVGFDELTQIAEENYSYLFSRLRRPSRYCALCFSSEEKSLTGKARKECPVCSGLGVNPLHFVPLRLRGATNPGGNFGEWVKRHFIPKGYLDADPDKQFSHIWTKASECILCYGRKKIEMRGSLIDCIACDGKGFTERYFIPARLQDNPTIDKKEYIPNLYRMNDEKEVAQLLHGRWDFMSDGTIFQRDWIKQYGWRGDHIELHNPEGKRLIQNTDYTIFMTADTASKIKTTNDYTVICVWALCVKTAALCLLEVHRQRMLIPDILPKILQLRKKWLARFIIVEEASSGITVVQEIMHTRRGEGMTVLPYSPHSGDKVARSQEAQIRMKNGQIYFPDTRDETIAECINELLLFFTPDVHDDFVDNMSMAAWYASGQWRNKSQGNPSAVVKKGMTSPISRFRTF